MKVCFKCHTAKSRDEFYAHPQMADGLLGKCKECTKRDVAANYAAKRRQYSAYEQRRSKTAKRKACVAAVQRKRRIMDRAKYQARAAVGNALRDGKLFRQPCEACGATQTQAHHDDYSKPLDVRWLCFRCHREHEHGQVVVASTPRSAP